MSHLKIRQLALITIVPAVMLVGCGGKEEHASTSGSGAAEHGSAALPRAASRQTFDVVQVRVDDAPQTTPIGGTVVSRNETTLKAQMPGRVVYIAGEAGTKLEPDQVIVALDDEGLVAKRRSAWAQLERAEAALRNAKVQYSNSLYSDGYNSQGGMGMPSMWDKMFTNNFSRAMGVGSPGLNRYAQVSSSRSGVEQAQSGVVQAQAALDELDTALRDKQTLSPGNVVILEKYIEVGDSIQPGQPLVKVGDVSKLQVLVKLPSGLITNIRMDQQIVVVLGPTGDRVPAVVERIYPSADPVSHTVPVKLGLQPSAPAAPGMYVTALIPSAEASGGGLPVIPRSAVVWRGSQASVFVVGQGNMTEMRMVRVGGDAGGQVTVLSGLRPGERVVANPTPTLTSGVEVVAPQSQQRAPSAPPMQQGAYYPGGSYPPATSMAPSAGAPQARLGSPPNVGGVQRGGAAGIDTSRPVY